MLDQLLQNSEDSIEIEIYKDGVLSDADGDVSVTISNPNGEVIYSSQLAEKSSTGKYIFLLSEDKTAILGRYTAVWSFSVSNTVMQHTEQFDVVSTISSSYLSVQEYRKQSSLDVADKSDLQLLTYIKRATSLIESYIGGAVWLTSYQEKQKCIIDYPNNGIFIQLNHSPIEELLDVSVVFEPGNSVSLLPENFRISTDTGSLEYYNLNVSTSLTASIRAFNYGSIIPYATVQYSAGFSQIPVAVELATLRLTDQIVNSEIKQLKTVRSLSVGDYSETYDNANGTLSLGKVGADEVMELLKEYKHPIARNRFIV